MRRASVMIVEDELKAEIKEIESSKAEYEQSVSVLAALIKDDAGKALLAKIAVGHAATMPGIDNAIALAMRQADVIPVLLSSVVPHQRQWIAAMNDMMKHEETLAQQTSEAAASIYGNARTLTLALAGRLAGEMPHRILTRSLLIFGCAWETF